MIFDPLEWHARAACVGLTGPDNDKLFFPRGEPMRQARMICAGCPVRQQCLDYALDNNIHYGVWGGKSERERKFMRVGRAVVTHEPPPISHGTNAGYAAHVRRGIPTCEACRTANSISCAARKALRQATATP